MPLIRILALCALLASPVLANPLDALVSAISARDVAAARTAIEGGADVNARDGDNLAPLDWLAMSPQKNSIDVELCELLLTAGADPNDQDATGSTCLHRFFFSELLKSGHADSAFLASIIRHGGRLDIRNLAGLTPFHYACLFASYDAFSVCVMRTRWNEELDQDSILTERTPDGWTPAMLIAISNDPHWRSYWHSRLVEVLEPQDQNQKARRKGPEGAMLAIYADVSCPSCKLWQLVRFQFAELNQATDNGHTVASLLEARTDAESLQMKAILKLRNDSPEAFDFVPGDSRFLQNIPAPPELEQLHNEEDAEAVQ